MISRVGSSGKPAAMEKSVKKTWLIIAHMQVDAQRDSEYTLGNLATSKKRTSKS